MLDQEPSQHDTVHVDMVALKSDDDPTGNSIHSKTHTAPSLMPVTHHAYVPCNNDALEKKYSSATGSRDSSYSHAKSERLTSTTDELSIDSEEISMQLLGRKRHLLVFQQKLVLISRVRMCPCLLLQTTQQRITVRLY